MYHAVSLCVYSVYYSRIIHEFSTSPTVNAVYIIHTSTLHGHRTMYVYHGGWGL